MRLHTALMGQITTPSGEDEGKNTATAMRAMNEYGTPPHRGDLARRINHRRTELGLSTEEVARRRTMGRGFGFRSNPLGWDWPICRSERRDSGALSSSRYPARAAPVSSGTSPRLSAE
jgi:hypothetical protein